MKRVVGFVSMVAMAMLAAYSAQGQDPRGSFYSGIRVGYNFSNVYDSQGENFAATSKVGVVMGGFMSIPINNLLGFQPELLFSQRGFHGTGTLLGSSYDITRMTSYLDLPLLFALKPIEYITILAGPQFSYALKQKDVFTNSATSMQQEQVFNNDNIQRNTLCLLSGVDVNLHPVVIGIRVGTDLRQNVGDGTSTTLRYKHVWLQTTVGFRF